MRSLLDKCSSSLGSWKPGHMTDLVLGLTLLEGPAPQSLELVANCLGLLETTAGQENSHIDLDTEDVSNLAWSCQKLGLQLPRYFAEATEGE